MSEYREPKGPVESVDPETFQRAIDAGEPTRLLDVRNRSEIDRWKIEGPTVDREEIPYMRFVEAELQGRVDELVEGFQGEGPVTVVCGRGEASAYVASLLEQEGIEARNLAEGMRGWARLYRARELDPARYGGAVTVVQYHRPASGCLSYLLVDGSLAAVVDPLLAFADRYVADAEAYGAELAVAVDTHLHADHVSGVARLGETTDAEAMLPRRAIDRGVETGVVPIEDGETIRVGETAIEAVPLPGHTSGMTGYAVDGVLLTGDSVFVESVARPDLEPASRAGETADEPGVNANGGGESPGIEDSRAIDEAVAAAARQLHRTLTERLAAFDDGTVVAPGHAGRTSERADDGTVTATLGELRARLPAFSMDREAFVELVRADLPPRPANFERIVAINRGRERADDEEALELELGPNNCALAPATE